MFTETKVPETQSFYNETIETQTVVTKPLTRKEQDLINEEMRKIAEAEKEKYEAEKERQIEQKRIFANYQNILNDFLNRNVGEDNKAQMSIHISENSFFWELFKHFSQIINTEKFNVFKKSDQSFDFASVYLVGKNGNSVQFFINEIFLQELKDHIPNMYLTSEEIEKYTALFNE